MVTDKKKIVISKRLIATLVITAMVVVCGIAISNSAVDINLTIGSFFNGETVLEVMTPSSDVWHEKDTIIFVTGMKQTGEETGIAELLVIRQGEKPVTEQAQTVLVSEKWLIDICED